jgi:glutaredoxin
MRTWLAGLALAAMVVMAGFGLANMGAKAAASGHEVYLFETSWCPYCHQLEEMLDRNNIKYVKYDIERDQSARVFMLKQFHTTAVPVIVIDGRFVVGFNEPLIRRLLSIA